MNITVFAKAESGEILSAGRYDYYLNEVLQPVSETWQLYNNSRGELVIDSCRQAGELTLRSRAICVDDDLTQVLVEWHDEHSVQALYDLSAQQCHWQINADAEQVLSLPAAPVYPLMRVFTGGIIKRVAQLGGNAPIIVPDIRPDTLANQKLRPYRGTRRCAFIADEEIHVQGAKYRSACWSFIGDQYGEDSRFWLDTQSNLLRYTWLQAPGQAWRVERVAVKP